MKQEKRIEGVNNIIGADDYSPWWRNYYQLKGDEKTLETIYDQLNEIFGEYGMPDDSNCCNISFKNFMKGFSGVEDEMDGELQMFRQEKEGLTILIESPIENYDYFLEAITDKFPSVQIVELTDEQIDAYGYLEISGLYDI